MGELTGLKADLAQIVRLALAEQVEDVCLFAARLVRKYRSTEPELAEQVDLFLRAKPNWAGSPLRKATTPSLPIDDESRLSLLKVFKDSPDREAPSGSTGA